MYHVMMFWPTFVLAAVLTGVARLETRIFVLVSCVLVAFLTLHSRLIPWHTMYRGAYEGHEWLAGYATWAFALAAAVIVLILAVWRLWRKPAVAAAVVCFLLGSFALFLGAWIT